jgi:hypothetical protein
VTGVTDERGDEEDEEDERDDEEDERDDEEDERDERDDEEDEKDEKDALSRGTSRGTREIGTKLLLVNEGDRDDV